MSIYRFVVVLMMIGMVSGCATAPSYAPTKDGSVTLYSSEVKLGSFENRIVYCYSVDGVPVRKYTDKMHKVDAGPRSIGLAVIDRAGRLSGRIEHDFEEGRKYRFEVERNPRVKAASIARMLMAFPRKGFVTIPAESSIDHDFVFRVIDQTDGADVEVARIPTVLTDDFEKVPGDP